MLARLLVIGSLVLVASRGARAEDGRELYAANCASCHGDDGRGGAAREAGYPVAMPDFTDCSFGTPEANSDWLATAHLGGYARGFDRRMPAFDQVLDDGQLLAIVNHLRTFCSDDRWPRGELNLPRPFLTEKAFPEDEAVMSTTATRRDITTVFTYERRLGARYQLEVVAPVSYAQQAGGSWAGGIATSRSR
ncbi:MAG: cytochrome c [Deltaproteobacteria bacterium]